MDGAAYLDLAQRLLDGDLAGFVQGYWSPVYPALLALLLGVTGASGSAAVAAAHVLNLVIALAAVALLWRAAIQRSDARWGVLALTAFLVASARTVRIDAVTPDLLLMVAIIGLGLELLRRDGWRPVQLGSWAGAAFLIKTSVWPWLMVSAMVALLALWQQRDRRRALLVALATAALPLILWSTAMSIEVGRPTLGSTGRLTACWYLFSCDGRTPDSHAGEHEEYHTWVLGAQATVKVATFPETAWTYAPWSDPSAWQEGMLQQARVPPTAMELVKYGATQLGLVIGLWMPFLLVGVLLPLVALTPGAPSLLSVSRRPAGVAMMMGVIGILQFVAVHAEPRLIAPFTMLFSLGWIEWRLSGTPRPAQWPVALVAWIIAVTIGAWHLRDQVRVTESARLRTAQLEGAHPPISAPHRVAVLGPALPMMPDLYRARARVVAQVMGPDPATMANWPAAAHSALAGRLQALGATTLWISRGRDAYRVVPLSGTPAP